MRSFSIDGYYVFNNKRFAFPAAYKMSLVQRHTTGSWMLAARYMQGHLYNSPEAVWDSYNLLDCFSTMQASIGGGYSVNFGRIYFSSQFTYNWFYFRSNDAFVINKLDLPDYVDDLTFQGSFRDWTAKGLLVYRF